MHEEAPIGVLLMAYGTPETPDQVEPYFTHIRGGRTPSRSFPSPSTWGTSTRKGCPTFGGWMRITPSRQFGPKSRRCASFASCGLFTPGIAGHAHSKSTPAAGAGGYILLANSNALVGDGTEVSIRMGQLRLDHVPVEG